MQVRAKLYGTLRRFSLPETPGHWAGELPEEATIGDLVDHLGVETREVAAASIKDEIQPLDTALWADVEVLLVTLVGGG